MTDSDTDKNQPKIDLQDIAASELTRCYGAGIEPTRQRLIAKGLGIAKTERVIEIMDNKILEIAEELVERRFSKKPKRLG